MLSPKSTKFYTYQPPKSVKKFAVPKTEKQNSFSENSGSIEISHTDLSQSINNDIPEDPEDPADPKRSFWP